MGMIQSSLNQLTGSILSGVRNIAILGKAQQAIQKPKEPKTATPEKPTSQTGAVKPELAAAKIKGLSPTGISRKYDTADLAAQSGNMAIAEKVRSKSFDIASRLSMLKKDEGGAE